AINQNMKDRCLVVFSAKAIRPLSVLAAMSCAGMLAQAADKDWPQWRGPLGTGVAPNANPPVTWSETNNVKWKVKLPGRGTATPVIWQKQIFLQTAIPTGRSVESGAD